MLEKLEGKEFPAVFEMMKNSFPQEEYRTYFGQKALLEKPGYTIYVKRGQEKQIQGFAAVWQWENLSFIEHLAVAPQYRNQGIGGEILKELAMLRNLPICLEVEPPEGEIAVRRVGFYMRNNFFFNAYPYIQPALSEKGKGIPLFIMTSGKSVTKEEFTEIKNRLYRDVYGIPPCPAQD